MQHHLASVFQYNFSSQDPLCKNVHVQSILGLCRWQVLKNLPVNAGDTRDTGLIPGSGRSPGEGNGYPLQYSCLENSTDRGAWWATVHETAKGQTQLSD